MLLQEYLTNCKSSAAVSSEQIVKSLHQAQAEANATYSTNATSTSQLLNLSFKDRGLNQ